MKTKKTVDNEEMIEEFKSLVNLNDADFDVMKKHRDFVEKIVDFLVDDFYTFLPYHPSTAKLFAPWMNEKRKKQLRQLLIDATQGNVPFKALFVVGFKHIQNGVSPRYPLAMISRIQNTFTSLAFQMLQNKDAQILSSAFNKLTAIIGIIFVYSFNSAISEFSGMTPELLEKMAKLGGVKKSSIT